VGGGVRVFSFFFWKLSILEFFKHKNILLNTYRRIERIMSGSLVLHYNKATFQTVSLSAEPAGAQNVSWIQNSFDFVTLPATISSGVPLNTHFNVVAYIGADGLTTQETYTYNVSDVNNNTLGSIQYILNYIDSSGGGIITNIASLNTTVFVANGVFASYAGSQVNMTFDNVTGDRLVTISLYGCGSC